MVLHLLDNLPWQPQADGGIVNNSPFTDIGPPPSHSEGGKTGRWGYVSNLGGVVNALVHTHLQEIDISDTRCTRLHFRSKGRRIPFLPLQTETV